MTEEPEKRQPAMLEKASAKAVFDELQHPETKWRAEAEEALYLKELKREVKRLAAGLGPITRRDIDDLETISLGQVDEVEKWQEALGELSALTQKKEEQKAEIAEEKAIEAANRAERQVSAREARLKLEQTKEKREAEAKIKEARQKRLVERPKPTPYFKPVSSSGMLTDQIPSSSYNMTGRKLDLSKLRKPLSSLSIGMPTRQPALLSRQPTRSEAKIPQQLESFLQARGYRPIEPVRELTWFWVGTKKGAEPSSNAWVVQLSTGRFGLAGIGDKTGKPRSKISWATEQEALDAAGEIPGNKRRSR